MKFNQNIQFLESVSTPSSVLMYMEKVQDSLSNARFWLNYTLAQECTVSIMLNVVSVAINPIKLDYSAAYLVS